MEGNIQHRPARKAEMQVSATLRENRALLERAAAAFARCRPAEARDLLGTIIEFFDMHCRLADHAAGVEHDQSTLVDLLEFQEVHEVADRAFIRRGNEVLQYMLARMEFERAPASDARIPAPPLALLMQYREVRERLADSLEIEERTEHYVMPLIRGLRSGAAAAVTGRA